MMIPHIIKKMSLFLTILFFYTGSSLYLHAETNLFKLYNATKSEMSFVFDWKGCSGFHKFHSDKITIKSQSMHDFSRDCIDKGWVL